MSTPLHHACVSAPTHPSVLPGNTQVCPPPHTGSAGGRYQYITVDCLHQYIRQSVSGQPSNAAVSQDASFSFSGHAPALASGSASNTTLCNTSSLLESSRAFSVPIHFTGTETRQRNLSCIVLVIEARLGPNTQDQARRLMAETGHHLEDMIPPVILLVFWRDCWQIIQQRSSWFGRNMVCPSPARPQQCVHDSRLCKLADFVWQVETR